MNFIPNLPSFAQFSAKMETQDIFLEDLTKIRQMCTQSQKQILICTNNAEKVLQDREIEIQEFQLEGIYNFLLEQSGLIQYKKLTQKLLKFFKTQFDYRPDSQILALKIYGLCEIQHDDETTEEEINLIFRMIYRFGIVGLIAYQNLSQKIFEESGSKIIDFIEKFKSLEVLMHLFRLDLGFNFVEKNCFIIYFQMERYHEFFVQKVQKQGRKLEKSIVDSFNSNVIKITKFLIEMLNRDSPMSAKYHILSLLNYFFSKMEIFKFDFKEFYVKNTQFRNEYQSLQKQLATLLYNTRILSNLENIFTYSDYWDEFEKINIFGIVKMMVSQISIKEFQQQVIPIMIRFVKSNVLFNEPYQFCQTLIHFIYLNQDIEDSQAIFEDLFCQTHIFNEIIQAINNIIEKMLMVIHQGDQEKKNKMKISLKLFSMLVAAFEILNHTNVLGNIYKETRDLLEKSVKFFKEISQHKWAGEVLDSLLEELKKQERQQNIKKYQKNWEEYFQFDI